MKTIRTIQYVAVMIIALCAFSCDGEDGTDGMDGMDGTQGAPGENGNANVNGRTIDPFPDWEAGSYLGAAANTVTINEPMLDDATTADALVLVYFQLFGQNTWYPMTYSYQYNGGGGEVVTFTYELNRIDVYSFSDSGALGADITKARYFIIPTEGSSGRSSKSNLDTLRLDLESEGVDIDSYKEVEHYFNK